MHSTVSKIALIIIAFCSFSHPAHAMHSKAISQAFIVKYMSDPTPEKTKAYAQARADVDAASKVASAVKAAVKAAKS